MSGTVPSETTANPRDRGGRAGRPTRRRSFGTITPMLPSIRHHRRRFSGRDPDEQHRSATPLELFYDLTIVVAFGTAADELAHFIADGARRRRDRGLRVRDVRGRLGVAELLVVRVGLRHRRLAVPARDDGADGRRDRAHARAAADVRVDRPRRHARQRRDGRRLRRHARAAAVPVVAGVAARSAQRARRAHLHGDDRRRAGRLGRADLPRAAGRDDVPRCSSR